MVASPDSDEEPNVDRSLSAVRDAVPLRLAEPKYSTAGAKNSPFTVSVASPERLACPKYSTAGVKNSPFAVSVASPERLADPKYSTGSGTVATTASN